MADDTAAQPADGCIFMTRMDDAGHEVRAEVDVASGSADAMAALGWVPVGIAQGEQDRDALKAEAKGLGIEFPGNIPTVKLSALIDAKKAEGGA